jgi:hypothetical protein
MQKKSAIAEAKRMNYNFIKPYMASNVEISTHKAGIGIKVMISMYIY